MINGNANCIRSHFCSFLYFDKMDFQEILDYPLISFGETVISVYNLVGIFFIFVIARLLLWAVKRFVRRSISNDKFDHRRGLAIYQISSYVIILAAVLLSIDSLGINIQLLLAGSAALLVGVGLGLQQTFNDLISGLILLFEGSVAVDDIVEIEGIVAKVRRISIRVSEIETREGISILVPNSKLTNDNVINWSHNRSVTRFSLPVGVAYGSNTEKVKELLEHVAVNHPQVSAVQKPNARFVDFGDSALQFELIFWSDNMFIIEQTKSDIRYEIDRVFREEGITIPFPQRDIHIRTQQK